MPCVSCSFLNIYRFPTDVIALTVPSSLACAFGLTAAGTLTLCRKENEPEPPYEPEDIVSSEYDTDDDVDLLLALAQRSMDPEIRLTRKKGRHVVGGAVLHSLHALLLCIILY